jgi:RNA polymerase sigma-70 factor, ECF subfamily
LFRIASFVSWVTTVCYNPRRGDGAMSLRDHRQYIGISRVFLYWPAIAEDEASEFAPSQSRISLANRGMIGRVTLPTKGYKTLHKIIGHTLGGYIGWLWWRHEEEQTNEGRPMTGFGSLLQNEIPRLRRYARALTRDATRADDLVQSCLVRALAKSHLWQPGTDLRAWLFTILHNQHVNDVRRAVREGINVPVEDVAPVLTVPSTQGASLQLRDLDRAMARLPEEQRQVLLLVGLEGMRYEEVAMVLDVPVGTVRSRLSRGRDMLRHLMDMKMRVERESAEIEEVAVPAAQTARRPVAA